MKFRIIGLLSLLSTTVMLSSPVFSMDEEGFNPNRKSVGSSKPSKEEERKKRVENWLETVGAKLQQIRLEYMDDLEDVNEAHKVVGSNPQELQTFQDEQRNNPLQFKLFFSLPQQKLQQIKELEKREEELKNELEQLNWKIKNQTTPTEETSENLPNPVLKNNEN